MTPDLAFKLASATAMIGWLLLVAALFWRPGRVQRLSLLVGGRAIPALLCVVYAVALWLYWRSAPGGNFSSLGGVSLLFQSEGKVLGGWLHFLAFDLFIGRWMVDDTLASGRLRAGLLPCLGLTFLYGPIGLLLYLGWTAFRPRRRADTGSRA